MPVSFWSEHRIHYRNVCDFCETMDNAISKIVIVSFANNLYFICVQLLRSIRYIFTDPLEIQLIYLVLSPMASFVHVVYFWFSLCFLIGRTLAVSLYAAEINEQSRRPLLVFRVVTQQSWCNEVNLSNKQILNVKLNVIFHHQVKRFADEVSNGMVALSGMKYFYLTRSLVLSVYRYI